MPSLVTDDLLNAIAYAESRGQKSPENAIGDKKLGKNRAVGKFQMRPIAYADVQRLHPEEFGGVSFEQLKGNADLQLQAGRQYLMDLEQHYGLSDFDSLVAAYNAGPTAIKHRGVFNREYVDTVKNYMRKQEEAMFPQPSEGDHIEQKVRKINRHAIDIGFGPLTVAEIGQILAKVTPPKAINGAKPKEQAAPSAMMPNGIGAMFGGGGN